MGSAALMWMWLLTGAPEAAATGTVRGEVRLLVKGEDGKAAPKEDRSGVVVYLTGYEEPPPAEPARMAQKQKAFMPSVLALVAGQKLVFANEDGMLHNVFSRSRAGSFDAGRNRPGETYAETFKKTGIVDVYCDIHEQMAATVVVVPNRAHAVTGQDGRFLLTGVRAGTWPLFAVYRRDERNELARVEVKVEPGKEATVQVELTASLRDEPHLDKRGRPYSSHPQAYQETR